MRGVACVSTVFNKYYNHGNGQNRAVDNNIPRIERDKHNNSDFSRLLYIQGKVIRKKDNRLTRRHILNNSNRYLVRNCTVLKKSLFQVFGEGIFYALELFLRAKAYFKR